MSVKKGSYDSAALRASRDQRFAAQSDPKAEAERYEASFLRNIGAAGEDYAWILANEAWLRLGFETFTDWYERRVAPVAARLGLRPARDQAKAAIEKAAEEQKALPKDQRRSQRELARVFGVSQATISRAAGDSNESNGAGNEQVSDPVRQFPAVEDAINQHFANQTSGLADTSLADESGEDRTDEELGRADPADSSAQPEVPGVASSSAPAEQEESPDSTPADEPEQREEGVPPAAPAPNPVAEKLAHNQAMTDWAQDTPEFKAAAMRKQLHAFMEAGWKFMDAVKPEEIALYLKPQLVDDMDSFSRAFDTWVDTTKAEWQQRTRPRLVKEA